MFRLQGHGPLQTRQKGGQVLSREAVDQIGGEVLDSRPADGLHRALHVGEGVDAAHGLQQGIVRGLHAQGQAVEPAPAEAAEGPPVLGALRVGLYGDLRVPGHAEPLGDPLQNVCQIPLRQQRGGAAAEVHRIHLIVPGVLGNLGDVGAEGLHIPLDLILRLGQGVEVAVEALAAAEGDVDVDAQGRSGLFHIGPSLFPARPEAFLFPIVPHFSDLTRHISASRGDTMGQRSVSER